MTDRFEFHGGTTPLLISIPHDGRIVPDAIAGRMTEAARGTPDADWHVRRLYAFAKLLGATVIAATYSRYVVDLNRSPDDEALYPGRFVTGLCPQRTFDGQDVYRPGESVDGREKSQRITDYWEPYHDRIRTTLDAIRDRFGYALLWDAHSIRSRVPLLFDGELPALNFGTNGGRSCSKDIVQAVVAAAQGRGEYPAVLDGRFKGGYITRHYGDPANGVQAMQLELAQRCYMNELTAEFAEDRASRLQLVLVKLVRAFLSGAAAHYGDRAALAR